MTAAAPGSRPGTRSAATRAAILAAAERLYAEHGLAAVSNRQISEAAGQGNVTAVNYHFGTRLDLVRAVMARHGEPVDLLRGRYAARVEDPSDLRAWVRCLVGPATEYLAGLGVPSWQARCAVQVLTDPTARNLVAEDSLARPALATVMRGLEQGLAWLPPGVRRRRGAMARNLLTHTCAERERALATDTALPYESWSDTADELEDALYGLLTAPVTHHPHTREAP
ncbi:TetR family transcriptional regulator [Streptomyces zinciresistens K42]|uniref:TetR family transcriptional regulator n=1 Tax=Streptomyces zinciresistens K42 TaxID=700597 RepID=G2G9T7_9ACTN|nr:TetR family transcriptional regulator [Streptomyces zinciresistens]EGX59759.1 TetR family transcriptional regulator [Streptomyces zinciresistens K42]